MSPGSPTNAGRDDGFVHQDISIPADALRQERRRLPIGTRVAPEPSASMPLESIAACVIGGVSLRGGTGRLGNVVLGAIFIGLVQNGMNLARIESYLQIVVVGVLLIIAVVADQLRQRMMAKLQD